MTEAYTALDNMIRFYGDGQRKGAQIPFNFEMISNVNQDSTAKDYKDKIDKWLVRVPKGEQANWVVSLNFTRFIFHVVSFVNFYY
jgi:alpha-glucosidase